MLDWNVEMRRCYKLSLDAEIRCWIDKQAVKCTVNSVHV